MQTAYGPATLRRSKRAALPPLGHAPARKAHMHRRQQATHAAPPRSECGRSHRPPSLLHSLPVPRAGALASVQVSDNFGLGCGTGGVTCNRMGAQSYLCLSIRTRFEPLFAVVSTTIGSSRSWRGAIVTLHALAEFFFPYTSKQQNVSGWGLPRPPRKVGHPPATQPMLIIHSPLEVSRAERGHRMTQQLPSLSLSQLTPSCCSVVVHAA
eukprot:scaffold14445_cov127-Isochrysis_galbana.AAC.4